MKKKHIQGSSVCIVPNKLATDIGKIIIIYIRALVKSSFLNFNMWWRVLGYISSQ